MAKFLNNKSLMAILVFVCLAICASAADMICVQFGHQKAEGWNLVNQNTTEVADLTDKSGAASGITLKITDKFAGVNKSGTPKPAEELEIPAAVTKNSLWGENGNKQAIVELSGLDTTKSYALTIFASRMGANDNRETVYSVAGATTEKVMLDAANNVNNVTKVEAIQANAEGKIVITINKGENNTNDKGYYYIGALKINEVE